jgi:hypothetical protein
VKKLAIVFDPMLGDKLFHKLVKRPIAGIANI